MGQSAPKQRPLIAAVFGPEFYLVRQAVQDLIRELLGANPEPMALSDLDGDTAELSDVLDELRTLPFLGDHRVVLLRGADGFISTHRQALESYADDPCPSGTLILVCKSLPANTKLHKKIAKVGRTVACKAPRGGEINRWISARCRDGHGCTIDASTASRLRELVGDSLAMLDNELAKLSLYAGEGARITREQVGDLVAAQREETVFGIIEAMLSGDTARAVGLWADVWATDRAAPGRAIGGLAWAMRRVINAKAELDAGASVGQVAGKMWIDPERLSAQVDGYTIGDLERVLVELCDADLAAKTGRGSVRDAVERLIIQTPCGGRADARLTCA